MKIKEVKKLLAIAVSVSMLTPSGVFASEASSTEAAVTAEQTTGETSVTEPEQSSGEVSEPEQPSEPEQDRKSVV